MGIQQTAAFVNTTTAGYNVRTTPQTSASGLTAGDSIASVSIDTSANAIENKKIVMGTDIKTAFNDVAMTLTVQVSHDGINWADAVTLSSDITPNNTGVKTFLADLTNIYAPYFRLHANSDAKAAGGSGELQMFYAYK